MAPVLPVELYIEDRPGSVELVEAACGQVTDTRLDDQAETLVALGLGLPNVPRASDLLFGTGVDIVSIVDGYSLGSKAELRNLVRLSIASGAHEVSVPAYATVDMITSLQSVLGSATALTVEVTGEDGTVDLGAAERSLARGADFVAYRPHPTSERALDDGLNLVQLASELDLGGVKIKAHAADDDRSRTMLRSSQWAMTPPNSRLCLPVQPVVLDNSG